MGRGVRFGGGAPSAADSGGGLAEVFQDRDDSGRSCAVSGVPGVPVGVRGREEGGGLGVGMGCPRRSQAPAAS